MANPTQAQVNQLVTRLIYDAVREAGPYGFPSGHLFAALEQYGCTIAQYGTFVTAMTELGLVAQHPKNPDLLVCPPGHEDVANKLAL